ncbi:MAG: TIGR01777 family oxidoreductase [Acidimicrobiales bacterium]
MRIAVTGASGLIGTALTEHLRAAGHTVIPVVRRPATDGEARWDPAMGTLDVGALEGIEGAVHLAGVGIGDHRLTPVRRQAVVRSRLDSTNLLARSLANLASPPTVLVSASAVGVYGDRGDEILTEESTTGTGFVAQLCRDWEAAAAPAREAGIRVVHLRSGIVLSRRGGALARQLPLFRLGLGGRLGRGDQWTSWISIGDEVRAIAHTLQQAAIDGPVNVVAPTPVTNRQFTGALARALHRPARFAVPASALGVVLGRQLAHEVVLAIQRVLPARLAAGDFTFEHPDLDSALAALLGR